MKILNLVIDILAHIFAPIFGALKFSGEKLADFKNFLGQKFGPIYRKVRYGKRTFHA